MVEHTFSPEWKERHASSLKKWAVDIKKKIEARVDFNNRDGWNDLVVVSSCGYCKEFSFSLYGCGLCPLYAKGGCYSNNYDEEKTTVFWRFVTLMNEIKARNNFLWWLLMGKLSWKKAESLRQKLEDMIREDTPQ